MMKNGSSTSEKALNVFLWFIVISMLVSLIFNYQNGFDGCDSQSSRGRLVFGSGNRGRPADCYAA